MKHQLIFCLCTIAFVADAQIVKIYINGQESEFSVKAVSNDGLYDGANWIKRSEYDSLAVLGDGPYKQRLNNEFRRGARGVEAISAIPTWRSDNPLFIDELPFDVDGRLIFSEVVQEPSVRADLLYLKAKEFFAEAFKSANDVIQFDDRESRTIIGKGFSEIVVETGIFQVNTRLFYSIKIASREARYKYEIYDLYYKSYPSQYAGSVETPAGDMFLKENYYKRSSKDKVNARTKLVAERYKEQTVATVNRLILQIKSKMSKASINSKDDW